MASGLAIYNLSDVRENIYCSLFIACLTTNKYLSTIKQGFERHFSINVIKSSYTVVRDLEVSNLIHSASLREMIGRGGETLRFESRSEAYLRTEHP